MNKDQEFTVFPEMRMVPALVKKPKGELRAPGKPFSAISVGASHVPGTGPAIFVGIHHDNGEVLIAALTAVPFAQLAMALAHAADQIAAGAFSEPESAQ